MMRGSFADVALFHGACERGLEAVAGRRNTVRAARFLLDRARLDGPNRIETNGELLVQGFVLRSNSAAPLTIIDVGAHFGEWSSHLLQQARTVGLQPTLHVFEPSSFTFDRLAETLAGTERVHLNRLGVSSRSGTAVLHKPHEGAGSSSLHQGWPCETASEEVSLTTLDEYCADGRIEHVHLLKIDAEGHDLEALEGAGGCSARAVSTLRSSSTTPAGSTRAATCATPSPSPTPSATNSAR
jgi:FkbM family methyltransferase